MKKTTKIAVISAMFFEIENIIKKLKNDGWIFVKATKGIILTKNHIELYLFYTGVGKKNAQKNTRNLLIKDQFDKFILVGFAGALQPNLKVGDILEPNTFLYGKTDSDKIVRNQSIKQISIVTVDKTLNAADKKEYSNSDIVDMETFFIITELLNRNISSQNIKVCKVVSDKLDFEFPDGLNADFFNIMFIEKSIWKQIGFLITNKTNLRAKIKILSMYLNFLKARERLTGYFCDYVTHLTQS